ncbi:hypothetical protein AIT68_005433, partial [Salmonella enterica subsp. salamae]
TEVNFGQVNKNDLKPGFYPPDKYFDITFSHCAGKTVQMTTRDSLDSHVPDWRTVPTWAGKFREITDVYYSVALNNPGSEVTGGEVYGAGKAFNMRGQKPLIITPGSDVYKLSPAVRVVTTSAYIAIGSAIRSIDSLSGSFIYDVTYM